MKSGLIIFIRNPVKGKAKTRLAKTMGDEQAFLIYNQLLFHTQLVSGAGIMEGRLETLKDIDEEKDIPGSLLQLVRNENPS